MWLPPVLQGGSETMASLRSQFHVNILDRVCLQCEPDSEDYNKVSYGYGSSLIGRTTYQDTLFNAYNYWLIPSFEVLQSAP